MRALVFDLGGTHLRSGIADDLGRVTKVNKQRIGSIANGMKARDVWRGILDLIAANALELGSLIPSEAPIVLSFPGPIDKNGQLVSAPTLVGPSLDIPDIDAELRSLTGRNVYLLNDLSAAAWYVSETISCCRFLVVTISSGIGSKIFDPVIGVLDDTPFSGEIGHSVVDTSGDAPLCDCGGSGHLGGIASGRGIERTARKRALRNPPAFEHSACCQVFGATPRSLDNEKHIIPALHCGDEWTIGVVRDCTEHLARVLVSSILVAGLECVILIGGFAIAGGEAYLRILREAACALCDYALLRSSIAGRIRLGSVTDEACLQGAGLYANRLARR